VCFAAHAEEIGWYVDSGASAHMSSNSSFFTSPDTEQKKTVTPADGQKLLTAGIGEGFVHRSKKRLNSSHLQILNKGITFVQHKYKTNPIILNEEIKIFKDIKGFNICFSSRQCFITKADRTFACATEYLGLYKLDISDSALQVCEGKQPECIHVWHNRLGHRDPNVIKEMDKHGTVKNLNNKPLGM